MPPSIAHALGSLMLHGDAGFAALNGQDGLAVRGPLTELQTFLPTLSMPQGFAAENSMLDLHVAGRPGATVSLLVSRTTAAIPVAPERGFRYSEAPERIHLGVIPTSGQTDFSFHLPSVPADATTLHLQVATKLAQAATTFSNPLSLVVIADGVLPECGGRVYVDQNAGPGGDGTSWATAFDDLGHALATLPSCADHPTQVWIAQGTYRPAPPGGDKGLPFFLSSGVHVYGGFSGAETQLHQRDPILHRVVLSGDLNGDDQPGFQNRADNTRSVVSTGDSFFPSENVRLDGVTVSGGEYAYVAGVSFRGGAGIRSRCNGLVVARCVVEDNRSGFSGTGAGMYHWKGGDIDVIESLFQGNDSGSSAGGLFVEVETSASTARITNCVVRGNTSLHSTGGMGIDASVGLVTGTTVYANTSTDKPGGLWTRASNGLVISNCILWGNVATTSNYTPTLQQNYHHVGGTPGLDYSCIEGWPLSATPHTFASDPQFRDPLGPDNIAGTSDDDLRLLATSPCIDAGSNLTMPPDVADLNGNGDTNELSPTDLDHRRRFVDTTSVPDTGEGTTPIVDMGAYENH